MNRVHMFPVREGNAQEIPLVEFIRTAMLVI